MELEFKPSEGTDTLQFGVSRDEVRNSHLAGKKFLSRASIPQDDMYVNEGLKLGYDENDTLEFIEVFPPSTCHFSGISLVGKSVKKVLSDLRKLGYESTYDDASYDFPELGIIFYCPENKIESASIYKEGYYD